ncbi:hypothetical protein GH714_009349 [Hevea brasiliensis]|uniref:3-hydroxyisobutyryl-CoA hydrolase n=1 Tax=Hevea brasiliensis TaxID=3981 RepID=A0A6A6MIJ4_HEVBR|nr:hypothetical protein GH714_009349 [Hevea brasiliensis]
MQSFRVLSRSSKKTPFTFLREAFAHSRMALMVMKILTTWGFGLVNYINPGKKIPCWFCYDEGEYLGLTYDGFSGEEMIACGLATDFSPSASNLIKLPDDFSAMDAFLACYGRIGNLKKTSVLPRIGLINECFGHSTIEEIINALILVEENANSRTVILNRPRVLNALDNNMIVRLKELYRSWERDPDVSFVVLKIVSIKVDITHGPKLGLEGLAYEAFELFLDAICVGRVSSMEEQLGMLITDDFSDIRTFLAKYANYAFPSEKSVLHRLEMVNKCFGHGTVEEIVNALENETVKSNDEWCISTLKKLKEAPPLSLKISLRSIQEGRYQTLSQCLAREYRMTVKAISRQISGDFCEVLNN